MQISNSKEYDRYVNQNKGTQGEKVIQVATEWADRLENAIQYESALDGKRTPLDIITHHFYVCYTSVTDKQYIEDPNLYNNAKRFLVDCWVYGKIIALLP